MNEIYEITNNEKIMYWMIFSIFGTIIVFVLCIIIIQVYYNIKTVKASDEKLEDKFIERKVYEPDIFFNSVFEILLSNTCILVALVFYDAICKFVDLGLFTNIILIILTILAIIANNIIDKKWLNKKWSRSIKGDEKYADEKYPKNSLRLVSSFFVLAILFFCWLLFKTTSFMEILTIIFSLVLGRFIYFDTTKGSLKECFCAICKIWTSALVALILICIYMGSAVYYDILDYACTPSSLLGIHIIYLIAAVVTISEMKDTFLYQ